MMHMHASLFSYQTGVPGIPWGLDSQNDLNPQECDKKGKRKVQGVPQSQTAALPKPKEVEETDKSKQAQTE